MVGLMHVYILHVIFYCYFSDSGTSDQGGGRPGAELTSGDDQCTETVSLIKLRGIKSNSVFGSANPYVAFTLGSHREKTPVLWGGRGEWHWKDTVLTFRTQLARVGGLRLLAKVYDKERIRRKRQLGSLSVKLAGLEVNSINSWFALDGSESGNEGELFLSIELTRV